MEYIKFYLPGAVGGALSLGAGVAMVLSVLELKYGLSNELISSAIIWRSVVVLCIFGVCLGAVVGVAAGGTTALGIWMASVIAAIVPAGIVSLIGWLLSGDLRFNSWVYLGSFLFALILSAGWLLRPRQGSRRRTRWS